MEDNRINYLYQKYLAKNLTTEELEDFKSLVIDSTKEVELGALLDKRWEELQIDELPDVPKLTDQKVYSYVLNHRPELKNILKLWPRIAVAAAIAIVLFCAGLFFYKLNINQEQLNQIAYKNDVAPGKTGATLTLANGKKIRLSDAANGELANEAGVLVTKSANGQLVYEIKGSDIGTNKINTLSTARGETYQVRLPDGSLVWLNAASSLTYSANLTAHGKRRVRLDGEGYFEIAKDKTHPFVVTTGKQEVEVLGTHFNINAYANEPVVKTTLIEGKVKVNGFNGHEKILKPGEQATLTENNLLIHQADEDEVLAWRNGLFIFNDEPLESIMRKIARWYDVEVIYEGNVDRNQLFGGGISRYDNISILLKTLEITEGVHFKIQGRRIVVTK